MTYSTQLILILICAVVAEGIAVGLTIALMIRKPMPLTTQVDKVTGVRTHGVGRWFATFSVLCLALPVLVFAARTCEVLFDLVGPTALTYWWVPLAAVAVASLALGGLWLRRWEHGKAVEPVAVEEPQQPPSPAGMWSLPATAEALCPTPPHSPTPWDGR